MMDERIGSRLAGLSFGLLILTACASTPDRPDGPGVLFQKPPDVVQRAAVDALVVHGFDVNKKEPLYVEGFRPRKMGLFVGSGGETVGIWLEPVDAERTRVRVDTARSLVGIAGQKSWEEEVLGEMEKVLGKRL